jgi:hypothetical protein
MSQVGCESLEFWEAGACHCEERRKSQTFRWGLVNPTLQMCSGQAPLQRTIRQIAAHNRRGPSCPLVENRDEWGSRCFADDGPAPFPHREKTMVQFTRLSPHFVPAFPPPGDGAGRLR